MRIRKRLAERRIRMERTQLEVLRDVMLSAGQCGAWLTLQELARLTHYGEASISAQLRHLRKPENGSYVVEKRRREHAEVTREGAGVVWEYRLEQIRRTWPRRMFREAALAF